jgi:hypothetical protein
MATPTLITLGSGTFTGTLEPLQEVSLRADRPPARCRLVVLDGHGRRYVERVDPAELTFTIGGALGWQRAQLLDADGRAIAEWSFRVTCTTRIDDGNAGFGALLRDLHFTMLQSIGGDGAASALVNGKLYRFFIRWLRDHTHTLKGMKYFSGELKTGLELYADTQRDDGMIYDRIAPKPDVQGWRDHTFKQGNFVRTLNPGSHNSYTLQRIPVENDVEYLFIECLYRTWQATGDDIWMSRHLDHALRALRYATTDRYRWSEKFRLLQRGYTIDTWDFLHEDDSRLTLGDNIVDPDRTTFGIMHGDNTGMVMACRMLAEMLRRSGRDREANDCEQLANDLLDRLDRLAWDDRGYYRHHVSEDPTFRRNVGNTDESAQVSLSNAHAINRGIDPAKARAIVETYKRIRREMPKNSPGEWFNIYPPFERGFDDHDLPWQYMNGGVCTIVAGELARGAFSLGDAEYGVDILRRVKDLADRHDGHLHVCFNGNPQTVPPGRSFTTVELSSVANVTVHWKSVGGWGEQGNDLSRLPRGRQVFCHVPFDLRDDGMAIGLSSTRPGFAREISLPVHQQHGSIYLLHTLSNPQSPAAEIDVIYADGERRRIYIMPGHQLDNWFMPGSDERQLAGHAPKLRKGWPEYQLAWRGGNDRFDNVGVFIWGWDNPRPEVEIDSLVFRAAETGSAYLVPAITFSDHPVWFPHSDLSFGIPDCWGAAAVVYAIIEGLAGVVDRATSLESVTLAPHWLTAGVDDVVVHVTYPASDGYLSYRWEHTPAEQCIRLDIAMSGRRVECIVPMPRGSFLGRAVVDGRTVEIYPSPDGAVRFVLDGPGVKSVVLNYRSQQP